MSRQVDWSADEIVALKKMMQGGIPRIAICKELGRSTGSVSTKMAWLRGCAYARHGKGDEPFAWSPPVETDHALHLALIANASGGRGFPHCRKREAA